MTAMKVVPLVQRLLDNWLLVGEFFASRNWPDTKLGNAARELNADMPRIVAALSAVEPAPDGLVERSERCADGCLVGEARGAHNACESKCAYADEPPEKTRQVILDCQKLLADWIVPDSGISDHDVLNSLLGILDGPQTREALKLALTSRAAVLEEAAKYLVWSNEHGCFWAANRCGYRTTAQEAGRYTLEEATDICRIRSWDAGRPPETILPVAAIRAAKGE